MGGFGGVCKEGQKKGGDGEGKERKVDMGTEVDGNAILVWKS